MQEVGATESATREVPASVLRVVGAVLLEEDDEWAVAERRYW